ncbi:Rv3235 family protein [Streptomyces sp. NBC_01429]|uniref:Rv3235 family protein n=1 Tax=Streptomyces sp. NBC_01429 TaxID=2903862 RepID=UPI002E2D2DF3|nr:Rv3235 family protein [Streptomyces sp. NBC_01429]
MNRTSTTTTTPGTATGAVPARAAAADRAAARTVAPARPPGRRDQRGPATTRPRRRTHIPPHELFAERLLAVLSGRRPVHWMLGHTVGEAYEQLVRLAPGTPLRARGARPVVRTCRGFQPCDGVVEASASIAAGEQVRALAFRLERSADLRWRCAAVEVGGERITAES